MQPRNAKETNKKAPRETCSLWPEDQEMGNRAEQKTFS